MKNKKKDNYSLSQDILNGASEYIRKKAFRKNLPIVIMENDGLYLLNKDNKKTKIESISDNQKK